MAALRHRVLLQAVQEPLPNRSGSKHQPPKRMTNLAPKWHLQSERVRVKRSNLYSSPRRDGPARSPTRRPRRPPPAGYAEEIFSTSRIPTNKTSAQRFELCSGQALTTDAANARRAMTARRSRGALGCGSIPGLDLANPRSWERSQIWEGGETGWQNPPSNCSSLLLFLQI